MTKEAMITYNTLHSAKRNKMERAVKTEARRAAWGAPASAGGLALQTRQPHSSPAQGRPRSCRQQPKLSTPCTVPAEPVGQRGRL